MNKIFIYFFTILIGLVLSIFYLIIVPEMLSSKNDLDVFVGIFFIVMFPVHLFIYYKVLKFAK